MPIVPADRIEINIGLKDLCIDWKMEGRKGRPSARFVGLWSTTRHYCIPLLRARSCLLIFATATIYYLLPLSFLWELLTAAGSRPRPEADV